MMAQGNCFCLASRFVYYQQTATHIPVAVSECRELATADLIEFRRACPASSSYYRVRPIIFRMNSERLWASPTRLRCPLARGSEHHIRSLTILSQGTPDSGVANREPNGVPFCSISAIDLKAIVARSRSIAKFIDLRSRTVAGAYLLQVRFSD